MPCRGRGSGRGGACHVEGGGVAGVGHVFMPYLLCLTVWVTAMVDVAGEVTLASGIQNL